MSNNPAQPSYQYPGYKELSDVKRSVGGIKVKSELQRHEDFPGGAAGIKVDA